MSYGYFKDKLFVRGFAADRSDEDIRLFCEKFGKFIHFYRKAAIVLLTYQTDEEASEAREKFLKSKIPCYFARNQQKAANSVTESDERRVQFSPNASSSEPASSHQSRREPLSQQSPSQESSCEPPPSIHRLIESAENVSWTETIPSNGEKVIITHVEDLFSFYVRPVSKEAEYQDLLKFMSKMAINAKLYDLSSENRMALAKHNGKYYRALIIPSSQGTKQEFVAVRLVDIGLWSEVPVAELRILPEEYTMIRITYKFQLADIEAEVDHSYALECFKTYVGIILQMKIHNENAGASQSKLKYVQLYDPDIKRGVNDLVKQMTRSFDINNLIQKTITIGDDQKLVTIDESKLKEGFNLVTLTEQKYFKELNKQRDLIQKVGNQIKNYPSYLPTEDELCLVQFDHNWHRGVFQNPTDSGTTLLILLVDIGKAVQIDLKYVRHITNELVELPIVSFMASLRGFTNKIDKSNVDGIIHKFSSMNTVRVKSVEIDNTKNGMYMIQV